MSWYRSNSFRTLRGFTLVELLLVVALVGVLIGIGSATWKGGVSRLAAAGLTCSNLMESAREAAILRQRPVAVVVVPGSSALTAFEFKADLQSWVQVSRWERLPDGVRFDQTFSPNVNAAVGGNSPSVTPALPTVRYEGVALSPGGDDGFAYLVFLPSGALFQAHSHPGLFRLKTNGSGDFLTLVINASTGRLKLINP